MTKEILEFLVSLGLFFLGRFIYDFVDKGTLSFLLSFIFGAFTISVLAFIRADLVVAILTMGKEKSK